MENAVIRFRAKGQNLSLVSGYNRFAGNTIGYIRIEIEPDDEWLDFDSVDALFQNEQGRVSAVLFYDSGVYVCNAPVEMTAASSVVFLNLSGKNVVNNVLVERLTTYPVFAFAIDRSANVTSYRETEVSANMYEQYIAAVGDQVEKITDLTVSAHEADEPEVIKTATPGLPINLDFGLVRGETGEQGIPGEPGSQGEPGVPGEKGDPFTYDDFTEEQLAALVGPQGPKGSTGDPAGFGNVTAEISNTSGTPTVEVTAAGPDTAKNIHFTFSNLKGVHGDPIDVQIDGESIVSDDVANIPKANLNDWGVVKTATATLLAENYSYTKLTHMSGASEVVRNLAPMSLASFTQRGLMSKDDKVKLAHIASGAEVNVQSDWNQTTTTADDYIKNKPTLFSGDYDDLENKPDIPSKTSDLENDVPYATADDLLDNTIVQTNTDTEPYNFRPTPQCGSLEYDTIVGGSVGWNQLAPIVTNTSKWNVNTTFGTVTTSGDALVYTITAKNGSQSIAVPNTAGGIPIVKGHKILTSFYMTSTEASDAVRVNSMDNQWVPMPSISANTKTLLTKIYTSKQDTGGNAFWGIYPNLGSGMSVGTVVTLEAVQVFDLTLMFGSTIADYIYSLETANAGAGVAFFKKLGFNKPYYAYDAGTLKSVSGLVSHDMTGFNQWDEEWVNGYFGVNGSWASDSNYIASKNPIRVMPNTTYCFSGNKYGYITFWRSAVPSGTSNTADFIKRQGPFDGTTFTTPSDCQYIHFNAYASSYSGDICINLSWDGSRNGEYEPYQKWSYPLDTDLTLRGIPKLDASNNLYYDGDTYESDGTVTRKYGVVDLGTLTWSRNITNQYFAPLPTAGAQYTANQICTKYLASERGAYDGNVDKGITVTGSKVWVRDTAYPSATGTEFKTAMSGVYLVYELAEPTTETADPYTNPQQCESGGTEEYVSDSIIPIGHSTDYPMTLSDTMPTANGTYVMQMTVANGKRSIEWVNANIAELQAIVLEQ